MPNISVYVNEDLKGRMEREEGENWSKVAAMAFEKRLAELIKRRTVNDMEAAIQRLRASRNEYDETINLEGFEAGKQWAGRSASFAQLKRLSELADRLEADPFSGWEGFFDDSNESNPASSVTLACELEGQEEIDYDIARDFWTDTMEMEGASLPEADFARAFAEGALEFYDQVVDKL